jgi:alkylhydroperoxidase family enzyme
MRWPAIVVKDPRRGHYRTALGVENWWCRCACAMTLDVKVSDDVFCAAPFDTTEIVELTSAIATYNMVARFLSGTRREPGLTPCCL